MSTTPTSKTAVAAPPETDAERRTAERILPAGVPAITGVRMSPGAGDAHLVNISTSGVLVRCATRLLPGTAVTVLFDGGFKPASVKGKVVRCLVADIGGAGGVSYHIGIAFKDEIELPATPAEPEPKPTAQAPAAIQPRLENRW
jgi:hypothetical protein